VSQLLQKPPATDATAMLYDRHHRRIRGYCLGQLRDSEEANDAVQSTFLYAFSSLQRGVEPREELPWLFTIAHNVCRTRKRSLRRRSRLESDVALDSVCDVIGRDDPSRDELEALGRTLASLPENQRRAFLMREWQGLSYAEVAARMGITESAVEAVLFRARRNLAQKLRATDLVASAGALIAGNLRRLGSLAGFGKTAAATLVVGLAAGTAIPPLIDSPRRAPAGGGNLVHHQPTRTSATAATRGRAPHVAQAPVAPTSQARRTRYEPLQRSQPKPRPVAAPTTSAAVPAARAQTTASGSAPADAATDSSTPSSELRPPDEAATSGPAGKPAEHTTADRSKTPSATSPLPTPLQSVLPDSLPDVPLPGVAVPDPAAAVPQPPSLAPPVEVDVPSVTPPSGTVPTAPDLPGVDAPNLPQVSVQLPPTPVPDSPTQSTPLQVP
jgi:RNA polymerase sigma-70 factor (ECF subfamily)